MNWLAILIGAVIGHWALDLPWGLDAALGALAGWWLGSRITGSRQLTDADVAALRQQVAEQAIWLQENRARLELLEKRLGLRPEAKPAEAATATPPQMVSTPPEPVAPATVPPAPPTSAAVPLPPAPSPVLPPPLAEDMPRPATAKILPPLPGGEPIAQPASAITLPRSPSRAAGPNIPPAPAEPSAFMRWWSEGNALVRIGAVILFFGVGFLLKYLAQFVTFPLELRVAAVMAGGALMVAIGWRLRERRRGYAVTLQGTGVGVMYLTTFAAYRLYQLLPSGPAFAVLVLLAIFWAWLAWREDAQVLAGFAAAGGFLAPILASTGKGSHVALFSFYLVLNLAIFALAWLKAWRGLNLLGFLATFILGLGWGAQYYHPDFFASTEPFLIAFFLLFTTIGILFARRRASEAPWSPADAVDGPLIFGVPVIAFSLQVALVENTEYGAAIGAAVLAAFYAGLFWLARQWGDGLQRLRQSFGGLAVVFATVAIPLAFDGYWTSVAWALEGAAVFWLGERSSAVGGGSWRRLAGIVLQLLAAAAYLYQRPLEGFVAPSTLAFFNRATLGALMLAAAGWFTAWAADTGRGGEAAAGRRGGTLPVVSPLGLVAFFWGLGWWIFGAATELDRVLPPPLRGPALALFFAGTAALLQLVAAAAGWSRPRVALPLLPLLLVSPLMMGLTAHRPMLSGTGGLLWGLAWLVGYTALWWDDRRSGRRTNGAAADSAPLAHLGLGGLLCLQLVHDAYRQALAWMPATDWPYLAAAAPVLLLLALLGSSGLQHRWPLARYGASYHGALGSLAAIAATLALLVGNFQLSGNLFPLPYWPLLNLLDVAQLMAVWLLLRWMAAAQAVDVILPDRGTVSGLLGTWGFVFATALLLRTLHHGWGIPFTVVDLTSSKIVQSALSVFWTSLSLVAMLWAARRGRRSWWVAGAVLLGVVVGKLFLIDLSALSGLARIVSFLGVGILLLIIGYVAPLPPAREAS